ncbi:MAG: helix-turn-helix domain-containing protein [Caulobacter sp.]
MQRSASPPGLRAVPLFAPLDAQVLSVLEGVGETRLFPKGCIIDDRRGEDLIVLLSGAVAQTVEDPGRTATISTAEAVKALNLACVMAKAHCDLRWRALDSCLVFIVPGKAFRDAVAADAGLATRAYVELAGAYQHLLSSAADQRLMSAQNRLVGYLLSLIPERTGRARARLPYEKGLLASLLGMTPENLSRAFARLSLHGVSVRGAAVSVEEVGYLRDLHLAERGPRRSGRATRPS